MKKLGKMALLYIRAMGSVAWFVVADIGASAIGLSEAFELTRHVPSWTWWMLLILGLIVAPFVAFWRREDFHEVEIERLKAEKHGQEIRDWLSYQLMRGQNLYLEPIKDEKQLDEWTKRFGKWRDTVFETLFEVSKDRAARFRQTQVYAAWITGSFNNAHNDSRLYLHAHCENLGELLRG